MIESTNLLTTSVAGGTEATGRSNWSPMASIAPRCQSRLDGRTGTRLGIAGDGNPHCFGAWCLRLPASSTFWLRTSIWMSTPRSSQTGKMGSSTASGSGLNCPSILSWTRNPRSPQKIFSNPGRPTSSESPTSPKASGRNSDPTASSLMSRCTAAASTLLGGMAPV